MKRHWFKIIKNHYKPLKYEDEKLCEISIIILINEDKTNMTYVELEKKLSDNLTELYGKSEKKELQWKYGKQKIV